MRELVLVHGRAQQGKDALSLKEDWLAALARGLGKNGLELPIDETHVRFPYYGDTLEGLVEDLPPEKVADIVVRGSSADPGFASFIDEVLDEVLTRQGVSEAQIERAVEEVAASNGDSSRTIERGVLNWGWVQGLLRAIDQYVPGGSGASIAIATKDVYEYLHNSGVRNRIDSGVSAAMKSGGESVVVSHSLGTVVAYSLLRTLGSDRGWRVPLFITLGSPLAVKAVRRALRPTKHPGCVEKWFNALDPNDVVSLYPMDERHFPLDPSIENYANVENHTENQHGITGYLDNQEVSRRIYFALTGTAVSPTTSP